MSISVVAPSNHLPIHRPHTPEPHAQTAARIPEPTDTHTSEPVHTQTVEPVCSHTPQDCRPRTLRRMRTRTFSALRARTERGAATAEYAVTIVAACGLGGILVALLKSPLMQNALKALINYALKIAGVDGVHL